MEIKLETGIPIPSRAKSEAAKYPWKEMKVGNSFVVPRINGEPMQLTRDRANKAVTYAKKYGHKYCTRTIEAGIRVWRIE